MKSQLLMTMPSPSKEQEAFSEIMKQMEEDLSLSCFICSHTFNTTNRAPTIICRRQHTYCAECVTLVQRHRPNRCPECRFKIYQENIFINRSLIAICRFLPQLKQTVDGLLRQNERLIEQNRQLKTRIEQMSQLHEVELQAVRRRIREEGLSLKQREERLFTIAKEKHKQPKTEIIKQEQLTVKTNKMINPEEKKGAHQIKLKRKYTKPAASTEKRRPESPLVVLEPMVHRYRMQT